ncbi:Alpha/Beta hydrolase protein [Mycena sanguinolenta]|nr:Alpha/Beta hydrolase protein [Mycena sanguinolenta]
MNVNSSQAAARDVWTLMQVFLADSRFSFLATHALAIWTESYGGHYGPVFAAYLLSQNTANAGIHLNPKTLGIGNGLTDANSQYPSYPSYAALNPYHELVPAATQAAAQAQLFNPGGCQSQITACNNGGTDAVCEAAQLFCNGVVMGPCLVPWNGDYVIDPATPSDNYPPPIENYLASIASQVGAEVEFTQTSTVVYDAFLSTGDWVRSALPDLITVVDAGIRVNFYAGDADYLCNYLAGADSLTVGKSLAEQPHEPYYVGGFLAGLSKGVDNVSYLRVFRAGHEVPAYGNGSSRVGEVAWQMYVQVTEGGGLLYSTNAPLR